MTSFTKRLISAIVAALGVLVLWYFLREVAFQIICVIGAVGAGYELTKILFKNDENLLNRYVFYAFSLGVFGFSCAFPSQGGLIFSLFSIAFCLVALLTQKKFKSLEALTFFQSKSILGFFYVGLLPSFAYRILELPQGSNWFLLLLSVVFAGDIGAYGVGVLFGKNKLMPEISPKKTIEGAFGGLAASIAVGVAWSLALGHSPVLLAFLAAVAAVMGQFGDLFESQLKRVADVKDSGRIMPGHGGFLDRIDGVLFASPVILLGALYLESLL